MTMPPLPRQINPGASPSEVAASVRDIVSYLNAMPKFEVKTVQSSTGVSHTIKTGLRRVLGLLRIQAYKTQTVDETLSLPALGDWRQVGGGLKDRVNLGEVNHTLVYLVIGE